MELRPDQQEAYRALNARCRGLPSKERRAWLAKRMGIEERYAIISFMDSVECRFVMEICGKPDAGK